MTSAPPAASGHSGPMGRGIECPMEDDPQVDQAFQDCVKSSRALSRGVVQWLRTKPPAQQGKWLKASVERGRAIIQPWNMEILYVLGVGEHLRFTQLQETLGISSRTLSDKLQALRDEGLVERKVFDEQPVRIEYSLTRLGRRVAALSTGLFGQLNHPERLEG